MDISKEDQTRIDELADQFESDYQDHPWPKIEDFLARDPELESHLLRELLTLEIQILQSKGNKPHPDDYLARFPSSAHLIEAAFAHGRAEMTTTRTAAQLPNLESQSDRIGPYKILQSIGKGGMGEVFMAEQTDPVNRRVALKVIKTDTPSKAILARFEAERQALAMMDHQNIAKVLDAGLTDEGRPYFAMELVKGIPITEYCDKNKLSLDERLNLFIQTCRAIQHAHQKGIIHRDIKPSNVLVTLYDGQPVAKVIDFGLVKALQDSMQLAKRTLFTEFGQVMGTLEYMSPEQAEMNALDVDTRADVYSLGVMLYELLTGTTPIGRDRLKSQAFDRILQLIREEEVTRPSTRLSDSGDAITGISEQRKTDPKRLSLLLKGDLDWIAIKALEKDRTRRYDGPGALGDDIQRFIANEAIEARPPTLGYRLRKTVQKHRVGVTVSGLLLFVFLAGFVATAAMYFRARAAETVAQDEAANARAAEAIATTAKEQATGEAKLARDAQQNALEANQRLETQKAALRSALARSNYFLATARWDASRGAEGVKILSAIPKEERNFEWYWTRRRCQGSDLTCIGHTGFVNDVAYSPNGSRIASASHDKTVRIWDSYTGAEFLVLEGHRDHVSQVDFDADGTQLVSASADGTIRIWNAHTGEILKSIDAHDEAVTSVSFSHSSDLIASGSRAGSVKLWNASTGEHIRSLNGHRGHVGRLVFSPDGNRIAASSSDFKEHPDLTPDGAIRIWDVHTGEQQMTLKGDFALPVPAMTFTPDSRIISGDFDNRINVWNSRTGTRLLEKKHAHNGDVTGIACSPDGRWIATASEDNTVKIWDASTLEQVRVLSGHDGPVTSIEFSPDGSRIASAGSNQFFGGLGNEVKVWDLRNSPGTRTIYAANSGEFCVTFSPSGDRIASSGSGTSVKILNARTLDTLADLKGHRDGVLSLAFSPDGKRLASGSFDSTIKIWDLGSNALLKTLHGHLGPVSTVSFSPDGTHLASASGDINPGDPLIWSDGDDTIKVWNVDQSKVVWSTDDFEGWLSAVRFSPDGKWVASGASDHSIKIRDSLTGNVVSTLHGHTDEVLSLVFSPDGKRLVSSGRDYALRLWDIHSNAEIGRFEGHTSVVLNVIYSQDGRRLASAGFDRTLRLWDTATLQELLTFPHSDRVTSAAFSPDGQCLASSSTDHSITLQFAPATLHYMPLRGHREPVVDLRFSKDRSKLLSSSENGESIVWSTLTGEQISIGTGIEQREFLPNASESDHCLAIPVDNVVQLVNKEVVNGLSQGSTDARLKSLLMWHDEQAILAEENGEWFAATFHRGKQLLTEPSQFVLYDMFHNAKEHLEAQSPAIDWRARLPSCGIGEALSIPRGNLPPRLDSYLSTNAWYLARDYLSNNKDEALSLYRVGIDRAEKDFGVNSFLTLARKLELVAVLKESGLDQEALTLISALPDNVDRETLTVRWRDMTMFDLQRGFDAFSKRYVPTAHRVYVKDKQLRFELAMRPMTMSYRTNWSSSDASFAILRKQRLSVGYELAIHDTCEFAGDTFHIATFKRNSTTEK